MEPKLQRSKIYYERWYDFIYTKADEIIRTENPCGISNNVHCIAWNRLTPINRINVKVKNLGCCGRCEYLSNNGCRVKALRCKLYLCNEAKASLLNKNPIAAHQMNRLTLLMREIGLDIFRKGKGKSLEEARKTYLHI